MFAYVLEGAAGGRTGGFRKRLEDYTLERTGIILKIYENFGAGMEATIPASCTLKPAGQAGPSMTGCRRGVKIVSPWSDCWGAGKNQLAT